MDDFPADSDGLTAVVRFHFAAGAPAAELRDAVSALVAADADEGQLRLLVRHLRAQSVEFLPPPRRRPSGAATWREEFPGFPADGVPQLPDGFEDESWRVNTCPSFRHDAAGLYLQVDWPDPLARENPHGPRFWLGHYRAADGRIGATIVSTNDWEHVLGAIERRVARPTAFVE